MITQLGSLQIVLYLLVLLLLVKPLGSYIACVYEGRSCGLNRLFRPVENGIYRLCGIDATIEMNWKQYLSAMLVFNGLGILALFTIQRFQIYLPLNPQHLSSPTSDLALNAAVSFTTNTDWQSYSGETCMSYMTQMLGFTTQNFLSAATGICLLMAFIRGLVRQEDRGLGNFWVDMVRGVLYVLLPLSAIFAIVLVSQGVIQTLKPNQTIQVLQPYQQASLKKNSDTITEQVIPMGPVASQVAIKQLGTNGGGFFNVSSAHPFENPTPLTNFLEMLALILIPAALCYTYGVMVHDKRQGWALLCTMLIIFIPCVIACVSAEQAGNPAFQSLNIETKAIANIYPGGNMTGKETRFGIVGSALWAVATTASSNGAVNSMHDAYTPLGGLVGLWMMHLGEVVFGGVGTGLYGLLMLVIITVFVAGLMVGRTPEYLGKKITPHEMKMASFAVLIMPLLVLLNTALAAVSPAGVVALGNPGAHGLTEMLYAFTSMTNNNGSAFSGLNANSPFYNLLGALVMLMGRYFIAIAVLAIAGSLVQKKTIPINSGTLLTHSGLFISLLIGITLVLGALSFLPALALGPIVEHLMMWGHG